MAEQRGQAIARPLVGARDWDLGGPVKAATLTPGLTSECSWTYQETVNADEFSSRKVVPVRFPAIPRTIGFLAAIVLGATAAGWGAQKPLQLELSAVPTDVGVGEAFPLTVRALDETGEVMSGVSASIRLTSFAHASERPVISEVSPLGEVIEIANPGETTLDLGGWRVVVGREIYSSFFSVHAELRLPPGTLLAPKSVFTWSGRGIPPGTFPNLVSDRPFNLPSEAFGTVQLLDAGGGFWDEVYLPPSSLENPSLMLWQGRGLSGLTLTNSSYSRIGDANHFASFDWTINAPGSLGGLNPELRLPWRNAGAWQAASPGQVALTDGVWSGLVSPGTAGGSVFLIADDGTGVSAWSSPLRVRSLPAMTLRVPPALELASEASAGVPQPVSVSLSLSTTNEFAAPTRIDIPAGAAEATFAVTNLDDTLADGLARVELKAEAVGYSPATATLWNRDMKPGSCGWSCRPRFAKVRPGHRGGDESGWSRRPGMTCWHASRGNPHWTCPPP